MPINSMDDFRVVLANLRPEALRLEAICTRTKHDALPFVTAYMKWIDAMIDACDSKKGTIQARTPLLVSTDEKSESFVRLCHRISSQIGPHAEPHSLEVLIPLATRCHWLINMLNHWSTNALDFIETGKSHAFVNLHNAQVGLENSLKGNSASGVAYIEQATAATTEKDHPLRDGFHGVPAALPKYRFDNPVVPVVAAATAFYKPESASAPSPVSAAQLLKLSL